MPGDIQPALFAAPNGGAVLLQTIDETKFAQTGAGGQGTPYRWTLLDVGNAQRQEWEVTDSEVLGWR